MAYVQPNSVIELFKGVNLDNRYLHTIYFEANTATHKSAAEVQSDYFNGLSSKLTFNNLMFRRYGSNAIKIQINCQKLLDYTYMRFKNTRTFEEGTPVVDVDYSKWFYCFITGIDYVNENTSVIYYEIDVMQTWFIQDGTIEPCMVLREHVNDDTFGNNLEEEPCGSEVYDYDFITDCSNTDPNTHITDFGSYNLVAQSSGATDTDKHIIQGQFTGCKYYWHKCDSIGEANTAFAAIANNMLGGWSVNTQSEDLIDLYLVPAFCCPDDMDSPQQLDYHSPRVPENQQHAITRPTAYDSYTPKNNKLFMYPFSYLMLSTHKGDTAMYRWEYFDGQYPEFRYVGTMLGGGEINCYPLAYNGIANNFDAGLTMDNFPKCAYSFDAYQAWVAGGGLTRMEDERVVNSVKGGTAVFTAIGNIISSIVGSNPTTSIRDEQTNYAGVAGGRTFYSQTNKASVTEYVKNPSIGGTSSAVSGAGNVITDLMEAKNNMVYEFRDAAYRPNFVIGKTTCCLPVATREANFYFYHGHVRDDEAKRIDDFFSCYGYAINKVKKPNLKGRKYFNFVMTQNCVINGNMPSSSKEAIGRIFDSGITFWHTENFSAGNIIGNYANETSDGSIDNPIENNS